MGYTKGAIPNNLSELESLLEEAGLCVSRWPVRELFAELTDGSAFLERGERHDQLRRVVHSLSTNMRGQGSERAIPFQRHSSVKESYADSSVAEEDECSSPKNRQAISYNPVMNFFEMELESTSYPGLPCILRTRHLSLDQRCEDYALGNGYSDVAEDYGNGS